MPSAHRSSVSLLERQPRIVGVGFKRIRDMLHELAPGYGKQATVEVLDKGYQDAVNEIRVMQRASPIDALVAAGSNGEFLRQHLQLPVVLVKVGGFDVMRALGRARAISSRIAIVTYGDVAADLKQFNAEFGLGIVQRSYRTEEEARDCVWDLKARGIEVVVAPGLVTALSEEAGMSGVFLYSQDAVREALDDAVEVTRVSRIEQARRKRLSTILGQLRDGVVAVDMDERIESLNPAMERILAVSARDALGRRLSEISPELGLTHTLADGHTTHGEVQRNGPRTLVTSRQPIMEQGVRTGAVLTCQDPASIQRTERHLRSRKTGSSPSGPARAGLESLIGSSRSIAQVRTLAARCARSDATVLILGESGTGKEVIAQGIHAASVRAQQPFVAFNCAAFSESLLESELFGYEEGSFTGARRGGKAGLFEAAHTGTLFLDEVGEMPIALQTRLLRVLQEREILRIGATEALPIDVRVMAATHRNLAARVEEGAFRRDLYYRLNILRINVPPVRERLEDMGELMAHVWARSAARTGQPGRDLPVWMPALLARARNHDWPGNVREIENIIERMLVYAEDGDPTAADEQLLLIAPELFASAAAGDPPASPARDPSEDRVRAALEKFGGHRGKACRELGISRTTLWRLVRDGKLDGPG